MIVDLDRVIELPNHSSNPRHEFEIHRDDVLSVWNEIEDKNTITLWHSHPNGNIGPSGIDLRSKTPFDSHLVVTIVNDELVGAWY